MKARLDQKAFTLIEVIITIVVAALMGVVIFTYMGNVLTRSSEPVEMVKDLAEAVEVMEEVTLEYEKYLSEDNTSWSDFKTEVNAVIDSGTDQVNDVSDDLGTSPDYEVIEVVITRNNHSISALFAE
ncbi:MAG: type II secretion system protein [Desulfatiglandaceae bacterium]